MKLNFFQARRGAVLEAFAGGSEMKDKNGMLVGSKIDEFAAQKILNAWDVVKGFIAREDAGDDI